MTEWPDITATYDAVADEYATTFLEELAAKPFDRALLDRFAIALTDHGPVWDVGCGPGHVTHYLAQRGVRASGVDISHEMLRVAGRVFPGLPRLRADMRTLPVASGGLAGVICFYSLIHLPRLEAPAALAEFRRALRPGGSLLLAVHGGAGEAGAEDWLGKPVAVRATLFGPGEIAALSRAAGLEVVEVTTRAPYGNEYPTHRVYLWTRRPPTAGV